MEHVLLVIHVIIAAALIGMVLLQRSDTDGFGLGSGGGSNLLSGRATANLMTRTTAILAGLFIANSLLLSILAANHRPPSLVDQIEQEQTKKAFEAPAVPNVGEDKAAKKDIAVEKKAEETKPESKVAAEPVKKEAPQAVEKTIVPETKPVKAKKKPAAEEDMDDGESQAE